jgi:hypothetical protein
MHGLMMALEEAGIGNHCEPLTVQLHDGLFNKCID